MARGPYRLRPERRDRIRARARQQARRQVRPDQRQGRRDIARTQRRGQRAAQGARRAGRQAAAGFRQAAANIGPGVATPGLARRQLQQQAASQARYGRGLATLAQRGARQEVRGIRQGLRQDYQGAVRSNFTSLVKQARGARETKLREREELRLESAEAAKVARRMLSEIPAPERSVLWADDTWAALEGRVANTAGIGSAAARRAIRRLRPRVLRGLEQQSERLRHFPSIGR